MKIFVSDGLVLVPATWRQALGLARHHQQAHLLVVAPDKAMVRTMFAARAGSGAAYHLALAVKQRKPPLSTPCQRLLEAGIIHPDLPGVFTYYEAVNGSPVVLVQPDGTFPVVGCFRHEGRPGDSLQAVPPPRGGCQCLG